MWCADPAYWGKTSPFLFPFIGKTVNMEYRNNGRIWPAEKHGFGQKVAYDVAEQSQTRIVFRTKDTGATFEKYPFHFNLDIEYVLEDAGVVENWYVTNTGENTMYFTIGAHGAYACPLNGQGRVGQKVKLYGAEHKNIIFSLRANDKGLIIEELLTMDIKDGFVDIEEHTFDQDALIFDGEGVTAIGLCDETGKEYVRVECDAPVWGVRSDLEGRTSDQSGQRAVSGVVVKTGSALERQKKPREEFVNHENENSHIQNTADGVLSG